jgi:hypothetical protein
MASIASQVARAVSQGKSKEEALQGLGGVTGDLMRRAQALKAESQPVQTPFGTVNRAGRGLAALFNPSLRRTAGRQKGVIEDTSQVMEETSQRIANIETRLNTLESSGGGDVTQPSATVNPGAQAVAGSMMGTPSAMDFSVGAAKMIEGKKINQ